MCLFSIAPESRGKVLTTYMLAHAFEDVHRYDPSTVSGSNTKNDVANRVSVIVC